jgi:hypothetical protein
VKFIVITTINAPSSAVVAFSQLPDWRLIVVADRKTPAGWECPNTTYLSVERQAQLGYPLLESLPFDHYARKMVGYVYALRAGAETIAESDDDNLPKAGWGFPDFEGRYETSASQLGFVNVYRSFTNAHVWPRGLPLRRINDAQARVTQTRIQPSKVGIWQGLADGDPDVDAIYRLIDNRPVVFEERPPLVLGAQTVCPFNSQNTAFSRAAFPLLYLPATVSFRFTDILRGLVAQPLLWATGTGSLGFTSASVLQERNPHDYLRDFESEIPCYLHAETVVEVVSSKISADNGLLDNLFQAYEALLDKALVTSAELPLLERWLREFR